MNNKVDYGPRPRHPPSSSTTRWSYTMIGLYFTLSDLHSCQNRLDEAFTSIHASGDCNMWGTRLSGSKCPIFWMRTFCSRFNAQSCTASTVSQSATTTVSSAYYRLLLSDVEDETRRRTWRGVPKEMAECKNPEGQVTA